MTHNFIVRKNIYKILKYRQGGGGSVGERGAHACPLKQPATFCLLVSLHGGKPKSHKGTNKKGSVVFSAIPIIVTFIDAYERKERDKEEWEWNSKCSLKPNSWLRPWEKE